MSNDPEPDNRGKISRRGLLAGIGLGAVGQLAGCGGGDEGNSNNDMGIPAAPAPMSELTQHAKETLGDNAATYLAQSTPDTAYVDHINRRAQSFEIGKEPPNLVLPSNMVSDVGGLFTNDLTLAAPIDLENSSGFARGLSQSVGQSVTPKNARAVFLTRRFFDPQASNLNDTPLIGHTEAAVVILQGSSSSGFALLVDRAGAKQLAAVQKPSSSTNLDKTIIPRSKNINAYIDHLTSFDDNGEKVYVPIQETSVEIRSGRSEYGGIRGVQYGRPTMGVSSKQAPTVQARMQPVGKDTNWENLGDVPPSARYPFRGGTLVGGVIEISGSAGGSGPWGPPSNPSGSAMECFNYDSRDACQACCNGKQQTASTFLAGVAVSCGLASGWISPVSWACYAAVAAALITVTLQAAGCRNNCMIPVNRS
jgi:hypothetical protein